MHRQIRYCFTDVLRTAAGHKFHGEFGSPNAYPRPRKEIQNLPHRGLVTHRNSVATAGDLVTHHGQKYLLAGQHILEGTKRFLAVEINKEVVWSRLDEELDPVTRMPKDTDPIEMDPALPVSIEPGRAVEENRFEHTQYRFLTAAAVQEGDFIDDLKVVRIMDLFGLRMVEVA
jgi:hypothetical protein